MKNEELNEWGLSIINRVAKDHSISFSVFYSPLVYKPDLMIIGDNPGGDEKIESLRSIPTQHEYLYEKYTIAKTMREKILAGDKLGRILENSVKTNRIFFRTPDLDTLRKKENAEDLNLYCRNILEEIIQQLQPKNILAESFGTFRRLNSKKENTILTKESNKKSLLLLGVYNEVPLYGINHPSRASFHKIDSNDWQKVKEELERRLC